MTPVAWPVAWFHLILQVLEPILTSSDAVLRASRRRPARYRTGRVCDCVGLLERSLDLSEQVKRGSALLREGADDGGNDGDNAGDAEDGGSERGRARNRGRGRRGFRRGAERHTGRRNLGQRGVRVRTLQQLNNTHDSTFL